MEGGQELEGWDKDRKDKEEKDKSALASASTDHWLSGKPTMTRMNQTLKSWSDWKQSFACGNTNFARGADGIRQVIETMSSGGLSLRPRTRLKICLLMRPRQDEKPGEVQKDKEEKTGECMKTAAKALPSAPALQSDAAVAEPGGCKRCRACRAK